MHRAAWVSRACGVITPLVQAMRAKLKTARGRALYRLRQTIVEPVLAHIKEHRGCRRFGLRGLEQVQGEWSLICLTHNLLTLFRYTRTSALA